MTDASKAPTDDGRGAFSTAGEGAAALSGLEIMRRGITRDRASRPGIGRSLNFWLVEADDGRVVFEGEPGAESLNPLGIIHGGWTLTIIDSACGCATMTALENVAVPLRSFLSSLPCQCNTTVMPSLQSNQVACRQQTGILEQSSWQALLVKSASWHRSAQGASGFAARVSALTRDRLLDLG